MSLSVIHLYKDVLPKTNCGECGVPTCMAFATKVILEKEPLGGCPHVAPHELAETQPLLDAQQAEGIGVRKDPIAEALAWARERATSMVLEDLPDRIDGRLEQSDEGDVVTVSYFDTTVAIGGSETLTIGRTDGEELDPWEQVLLLNHLAQGGSAPPVGKWIGLEQLPNSTSKTASLREHVEEPLAAHFQGRPDDLRAAAAPYTEVAPADTPSDDLPSADVVLIFRPLPRVPLALLFWDADPDEGFEPRIKILYDETVNDHLDIESVVFLAEQLRDRLKKS